MNETNPDNVFKSKHRFHALCPYFAMFPETFARTAILQYSRIGDLVFDPFSGRGTTLLESLLNGREAIASDVNPVAYCISYAKAVPPKLENLIGRIDDLEKSYRNASHKSINSEIRTLPEFFVYSFSSNTLRELIYLKQTLNWKKSNVDMFVMALILGSLHGEANRSKYYLSNQLPHTISPKPQYSIKYWKERNLIAPQREVFALLRYRAIYRYKDGTPPLKGKVVKTDSRKAYHKFKEYKNKVSIVVTSPPYLDVTNYEEDQWLRLWMLGGAPHPTYRNVSKDDRHANIDNYFSFLSEVWRGIKPLLANNAKIVCRIGTKKIGKDTLLNKLMGTFYEIWPNAKSISEPQCSKIERRQTDTFRPGSEGCGVEWDIVLSV